MHKISTSSTIFGTGFFLDQLHVPFCALFLKTCLPKTHLTIINTEPIKPSQVIGSSMAKKKSWFSIVKRFFISDSQSKQDKKEKRRKWIFGRLKIKRLASLAAPPPLVEVERTPSEADEKQTNHALNVAIASAATAEAAVAAAQAAAEVVRLTTTTPEKQFSDETPAEAAQSKHQNLREFQESAAVKIQATFRGYLARKALRALKGIVTLQAIIRGRAVRRQAITTLKRLQSIINIQSQVCANRFQTSEEAYQCDENQFESLRDKILRMDSYNQRRWDDSLMSKEDAEAKFWNKKEAMIKRERIKEYWYSHRKSAETDRNKVSGRWRYWLEQWVDTQLNKSKELEDLDTVFGSKTGQRDEFGGRKHSVRSFQNKYANEGMDSPVFVPRRSVVHRKQCSLGDENSFTSSPIVPTYMAATESARAKARSISSPKLRQESLDGYSPSKNKLSLVSSITSEVPISYAIGRLGDYHQRSPSLKGVRGPIKSSRKIKELGIDSKCSLSHWDGQSAFG